MAPPGQQVIPFFAYPTEEAATKLLLLALCNIEKNWKMAPRTWKQAANRFAIMLGGRFTNAIH